MAAVGSGKSHHFAERIVDRMIEDPTIRAVCIREVQKSLRESAYRLIGDKIGALGVADRFRVLHDRIETPQGGVVIFMGMQDHTAESIKSLEGFRIAWVEEAQTLSEKSLELLRPTIRAPGSQMYFSWNPRNRMDAVDKFLRGDDVPKGAAVVQVNYDSNPWFPKELEAERLLDHRMRPDRYSHIWLGDYEPQAVGAIWTMRDINEGRQTEVPNDLSRILIAVDPAVSSHEHSDEHGVMVVASSQSGHGYVLEDGSTRGAPEQWARRAIAMYDRYDADGIVIEKNQGGDMCRHVLEQRAPRHQYHRGARDTGQARQGRAYQRPLRSWAASITSARSRSWKSRCARSRHPVTKAMARPTGLMLWSGDLPSYSQSWSTRRARYTVSKRWPRWITT
jgi:hypothetical protein